MCDDCTDAAWENRNLWKRRAEKWKELAKACGRYLDHSPRCDDDPAVKCRCGLDDFLVKLQEAEAEDE